MRFMNTEVIKITDVAQQKSEVEKAARLLKEGEAVAIPTETVYGLAANALDPDAIAKIFTVKGRPQDNPLILHISELSELSSVTPEIPEYALRLALKFWPGPLTMIFKRQPKIPPAVSAGLSTVAVRCPSHPVARAIIKASGVPLAAPSANLSGKPSPTSAEHVLTDLNGKIPLIIDGGPCSVGVESTVLDLTCYPPRLLRPGGIPLKDLSSVVGKIEIDPAISGEITPGAKVSSPGMKYKHYAPKAHVKAFCGPSAASLRQILSMNPGERDGVLCFDGCAPLFPDCFVITYGGAKDYKKQAASLFDALRRFDEQGVLRIYAQCPPDEGIAFAVSNRLKRASGFDLICPSSNLMVVGLTGRSGSGKSTVAAVFEKNGAAVIDADLVYRGLCKTSTDMKKELCRRFGDVLNADAEVDRKKLASIVFSSKDALSDLNRITHRYVLREVNDRMIRMEASGIKCAVLDAPLLFESAADKLCDVTVGIIAAKPDMVNRVVLRDGITYDEARMRLNAQPEDLFYIKSCDMILENNGSLRDLSTLSSGLYQKIMSMEVSK